MRTGLVQRARQGDHAAFTGLIAVDDDPQRGYAVRGYTIFAGRQDLETGQTSEAWTAQYIANKSRDAAGG